jgi:hypothetical protein
VWSTQKKEKLPAVMLEAFEINTSFSGVASSPGWT